MEQTPGMTEASGFDLDFQILDEPLELPQEEPEEDPIEQLEVQDEDSEDAYVSERSLPFVGAFGGLRNRNIIAIEDKSPVPEGQFRETDQGTAFWSAEEVAPVTEHEGEEVEAIETEDIQSFYDESLDDVHSEERDFPGAASTRYECHRDFHTTSDPSFATLQYDPAGGSTSHRSTSRDFEATLD